MREKLTFWKHFTNNKPYSYLVVIFSAIFIFYGILDGYLWVSGWGGFILLAFTIGILIQLKRKNRGWED